MVNYFQDLLKSKIESIQQKHNIEIVSDYPTFVRHSVYWKCKNGHQFKTSVMGLCKSDKGCIVCSGKSSKNKIDYENLAKIKHCKFIGDVPRKIQYKTLWECSCGNIKMATYNVVSRLKNNFQCETCRQNTSSDLHKQEKDRYAAINTKLQDIDKKESWAKLKTTASIDELRNTKGIIYLFTNKINNKVLVGQTIHTFTKRYKGIPDGWARYASNTKFSNALLKYKIENFDIVFLERNINTKQELNALETMYIKKYRSDEEEFGYNVTPGGENEGFSSNHLLFLKNQAIARKSVFIDKSIKLHKNKYDYSKIIFRGMSKIVDNIYCHKCQCFFSQKASLHATKYGHKKCGLEVSSSKRRLLFSQFVERSIEKHHSVFEYDAASYTHSHGKINIFCNNCCRWFSQQAKWHLNCSNCCPNCRIL